ncbi:NAD(P)-dependent dehydrogenase (short-subunit alcohol dehydrogenase family) [Microbacterium sp. BE35]|uniref:SDR family oxidoreductase n=1 Tax=Microbacterium sp. BE35 TaxID=2817773 RepID=UPI0028660C05|nr:SDR family oxidoreductase [Microbacterium sp. BE35]MDR7188233.1 NAD(P)-dependent dehydrogenase (short-subunit alcohol dehydrogenase family) [Microbacterium sp. BE35]
MSATSLGGATVVVTGANGGLGSQFVAQALQRGARKVYATARNPRQWADSRVATLSLDVLDGKSIAAAVANSTDATVVVNNAAIYPPIDSLLYGDQDEFRRIFDTNFFGAVEVVRGWASVLAADGGGTFVNVHSAASWRAANGAYSASKAALWSASNALRLELASQNTHVLSLFMGWVDTPMVEHERDVQKAKPSEIVAATYDGLEAGVYEVLGDDFTRATRANLSRAVEVMYPELITARRADGDLH